MYDKYNKIQRRKKVCRKILTSITLSVALLFTFSIPVFATNTTNTNLTVNRLSGQNRYDTSSAIAKQGWPNGSSNCILTFGGNYPDSLAFGSFS